MATADSSAGSCIPESVDGDPPTSTGTGAAAHNRLGGIAGSLRRLVRGWRPTWNDGCWIIPGASGRDEPWYAKSFIDLPPEALSLSIVRFARAVYAVPAANGYRLAPLLPSDYNSCRSDVKFLEYASQGVAGIYADLEPYRGIVVDAKRAVLSHARGIIARLDLLAATPPYVNGSGRRHTIHCKEPPAGAASRRTGWSSIGNCCRDRRRDTRSVPRY